MNREPAKEIEDPKTLLLGQVAYYRVAVLDKLEGLSDAQLRATVLPSGWSPLEPATRLP